VDGEIGKEEGGKEEGGRGYKGDRATLGFANLKSQIVG